MENITSTVSNQKYDEWYLNEISKFVYGAKDEEEAIHNTKIILQTYEKRLTFRQLLKLMLNKLK